MAETPRTVVLGAQSTISVSATTEGTPSLTDVAAVRDLTINRSTDTVDTSAKDTFPTKTEVPTNNIIEVTFQMLNVTEHIAVRDIMLDAFDAETVEAKKIYALVKDHAYGRGYEGVWYVTQFNQSMPYQDVETFDVTLKPASKLTVVKGDYSADSSSSGV